MDAILRLYDNVAALKALSGQLADDHGGLAHMLQLLALDIEVCGEALEAKEVGGRSPACGVAMSDGMCAVVKIGKDGDIKANVFSANASRSEGAEYDDDDDGDDVDGNDDENKTLN